MFLNIFFDILLIGILVAGVIIGIKKGFIATVEKPVRFFTALFLAFALASVVGSFLVEPIIGPSITNKLSSTLIERYSDITADTANEDLPTLVKFAAGMYGISIKDTITAADGVDVIEKIAASVADPIVKVIASLIGFAIVFFVVKALLKPVMKLVDKLLKKSGPIGHTNKIIGSVFMGVLAFMTAWLFTSILGFFLNIPVIADTKAVSNFTGGYVYRFFEMFSPLDLLLSF